MITINYLAHGQKREYFSKLIFYFLNKIKDENKKKINLNILLTGDEEVGSRWEHRMKNEIQGIDFAIVLWPGGNNYLNKIFYAAKNSSKYAIKMDEDFFINNYIWDFMIENAHILDDKQNLSLAPLSASGIPTSELCVNSYFDKDTVDEIHKSLLDVRFSPIWGYDYSHLNEFTVGSDQWDGDAFYRATNSIPYHYKGINPYRVNSKAQNLLNDKLLENLDKFTQKLDYKLITLNRYFCNHCNMMLTSEWESLVFDRSLYVDDFEEVPFNRYAIKNNQNFVFIENAFGIHPMYNTIFGENNNPQRELDFVTSLQNKCMENTVEK